MAKKFAIPFAATGDKAVVPDALQPDGSVSYTQGFGPDYELDRDLDPVNAKDVPRDETNQLFFDVTDAIGEIQRNGYAAWSSDMGAYPLNARTYHDEKVWRSTTSNNTTEPGVGAGWIDASTDPIAGQDMFIYQSSGVYQWTVPEELRQGIKKAKITVIAGGGAGSRVDATAGGGGGGGGGAVGLVSLDGVSTVSVTVGSGGLRAGSGQPGGNGNSSSFGSYLSASGGTGGTAAGQGGSGGSGSGSGTFISIAGGSGFSAFPYGADIWAGGSGGSSFISGSTRAARQSGDSPGESGVAGSGGSGSARNANAGNGGGGKVIIEW